MTTVGGSQIASGLQGKPLAMTTDEEPQIATGHFRDPRNDEEEETPRNDKGWE